MVDSLQQLLEDASAKQRSGDIAGAIAGYQRALVLSARSPHVLHVLAILKAQSGQVAEAIALFEEAVRKQPTPQLLSNQAIALSGCGRTDQAMAAYERALAMDPAFEDALAGRLTLLHNLGQLDEARTEAQRIRSRFLESPSLAYAWSRMCADLDQQEQGVEALQAHLADPALPEPARELMLYQLGALLDDLGSYDDAFDAICRANLLRHATYDAARWQSHIDELIAAWPSAVMADLPRCTTASDRPVFIVGMPRSGTSLVERIIAAHPAAHAAGERTEIPRAVAIIEPEQSGRVHALLTRPDQLTQDILTEFSSAYISALAQGAPEATRITDKLPDNYLHLGFIAAAFPRARFLHCTRSPMDTCLSCYFHRFLGAYPYAYDLADLGHAYRQYARTVDHWKSVIDHPILDVPYESLVEDQEAWSRRIIEFIGLPWHDHCLEFHRRATAPLTNSFAQVRRPIYRHAVNRAAHYVAHLGSLQAALGDLADTPRR